MDEVKLLPCPFCGGEGEVREWDWPYVRFQCRCTKCKAQARARMAKKSDAITAWNTRALAALTPAQDDGLEKELSRIAGWINKPDYREECVDVLVEKLPAILTTLRASNHTALLREAMKNAAKWGYEVGHSDGWLGNQQRRDVQHVDRDKGWQAHERNGAIQIALDRIDQALAKDKGDR